MTAQRRRASSQAPSIAAQTAAEFRLRVEHLLHQWADSMEFDESRLGAPKKSAGFKSHTGCHTQTDTDILYEDGETHSIEVCHTIVEDDMRHQRPELHWAVYRVHGLGGQGFAQIRYGRLSIPEQYQHAIDFVVDRLRFRGESL